MDTKELLETIAMAILGIFVMVLLIIIILSPVIISINYTNILPVPGVIFSIFLLIVIIIFFINNNKKFERRN